MSSPPSLQRGSSGPTVGKKPPTMLGATTSSSRSSHPKPMISSIPRGRTVSKLFEDQALSNMLNSKVVDEVEQSKLERFRLRCKYLLASTWGGKLYTNVFLILSVLSCVFFIVQTYYDYDDTISSRSKEFSDFLSYIEFCWAAAFAFDWFLELFIAEHKLEYIFSFFAIVDLITVIPTFVTEVAFQDRVSYERIDSLYRFVNYAMWGFRTVRILRVLRVYKYFSYVEDPVQRFLQQLALSFFTMLLFDAALIQYLEFHIQPLQFHVWIYVMTVTMCTVGYGDISPMSVLGRFAIMAIIFFAIVFVPMQSNKLIEMMSRQSIYARAKYKPRGLAKHVIICGDLKSTSLPDLFKELFHEDHENMNLHAVILQPEPPSFEMQEILLDPVFSLVVHYIEGSPLIDGDLARARAETATAIFLLSNKFCIDADTEDTKTILQQLSIDRYIKSYGKSSIEDALFCIQLLRPENRKHLGADVDDDDTKLVVCLNEMKMGVLAKGCLFPGVSTLIFNLLSSFADDEDPTLTMASGNKFDPDATEEDEIGTWLEEYEKGCGWEIYITELADAFEGQKFVDLSYTLYEKFGIVLFALKITDLKGRQHTRVLLNPAEFILPKKDEYKVEGFVVAKNKKQSDLSFNDKSDIVVTVPVPGRARSATDATDGSATQSTATRKLSKQLKQGSLRWQDIKNEYDANRESQVGNVQEILSKQEDAYLQHNYFVRSRPQSLQDATIATSVLDEIPNVNQHIIIIGKGLGNLYDFIRPWRAKYLGRLKHVVILSPEDISEAIWRRISIFEGILFVKGSALEENDLRRAGIFKASQVVVLADAKFREGNALSSSSDALEDADSIFSYQLVKRLNEKAHVVVEIIHTSNVSYLDISGVGKLVSEDDYKFTPPFASGQLFTSSLLDTVLCQAFYNPQIIKVVDKLITGTDHKPEEKIGGDPTSPSISKKHSKKNKNEAAASKVNTKLFDGMGSSLHQIMVPDKMTKRTYGHLFYTLSQMGMIPLGLLRGTFPAMNVGPKGNKQPYVYTNPSKDTEVFSCDKVFVLSQKSLNNTKYTTEEIHDNFLKATENAINARRAERELELDGKKESILGRELDSYVKTVSGDIMNLIMAVQELKKGAEHESGGAVSNARRLSNASSGSGQKALNVNNKGVAIRKALDNQRSMLKRKGTDKSMMSAITDPSGMRSRRNSVTSASESSQSALNEQQQQQQSNGPADNDTSSSIIEGIDNNRVVRSDVRRRSSSSTISEFEPNYRV